MNMHLSLAGSCVAAVLATGTAWPTELVTLAPDTWDAYAPRGKEVDCIYGDYVLRNDHIVAVIARPVPGRNASMTVRDVGGMLIDLTLRDEQRDQLSAFYAGSLSPPLDRIQTLSVSRTSHGVVQTSRYDGLTDFERPIQSQRIRLVLQPQHDSNGLRVTTGYALEDSDPFITVTTKFENRGPNAIDIEPHDSLRADRSFAFGSDAASHLFWAYDEWHGQAYGVVMPGYRGTYDEERLIVVRYDRPDGATLSVAPGDAVALKRYVFPADDLLGILSIADRLGSAAGHRLAVSVADPNGPVPFAKLTVLVGGKTHGWARTGQEGCLVFDLPPGEYELKAEATGRPSRTRRIKTPETHACEITLPACGYLVGDITDADGQPVPCKVALHGTNGTPDPFFGPDTGDVGVRNLLYSHNGHFRQELGPGEYDAIVSYGPEYDAAITSIEIRRGEETRLEATLVRSVDTRGWISADFHSHSSPSGDNTSSQFGRVLNLLCEHVEFAPCTEHNRLSTYAPHLEKLHAAHKMATCVGIELTGRMGSVNHQNAFPLIRKPRIQDAGAPLADNNPVVQIERLALWDEGSEKLVQTNHPTIPQIVADRDLDRQYDGGFADMLGFMDVIEVHPLAGIFSPPDSLEASYRDRNPMFHWMQLLNLGYRVPGVVNTDAHYNFHGSGGLRNFIKSPTDDPAEIDTMDMVRAAEAGHIVMSNGPFMEVRLRSGSANQADAASMEAIPGDERHVPGGRAELVVRVQCSNWLDVNRVQVFLNGRPSKEHNYTIRTSPQRFQRGVVKFDSVIPLLLSEDTHVIVAAAGEKLQLGRLMGPDWGKKMPTVVSNPIFVDVDGDGFQANGDLLDVPLPAPASE